MNDPIAESLRTIHSRGADEFSTTGLAADVGPTVRRVTRRRVGRVVTTGLAAVALVAGATVGALAYSAHPVGPAGPSSTPSQRAGALSVTVDPGAPKEQVIRTLEASLGIRNADFYFAIEDPASIGLPAEANGNVEGWLAPGTYSFDRGVTATDVLATMVRATVLELDAQGVAPADRERVLTVASLVDMEAPFADDRSKTARVLLNRLAEGVPLDLEAGVSFVRSPDGTLVEQVNPNIYRPGNTNLVPGLPPTPLSSPSAESIDAVLHPADGPWLYFVPGIPPTGQTHYLTTYDEYQRYVAEFGAWMMTNSSTN
jgi:UPF0755 protein